MDQLDVVYVSSACNRTPHSADWGTNKLICYGACNSVALYDPKVGYKSGFSVVLFQAMYLVDIYVALVWCLS